MLEGAAPGPSTFGQLAIRHIDATVVHFDAVLLAEGVTALGAVGYMGPKLESSR